MTRAPHPRLRLALLSAIATTAALLGTAAPAQAAPVTIDFESGAAVNEAVTNQYGQPGTVAGPEFKKGTEVSATKFKGLNCGPPHLSESGPAHSGSRSIVLDGCQTGEFYPTAGFFHMGYSTHLVEFWLAAGSGVEVWTTAFSATGAILAQQQTVLTGSAYQHVEVQSLGDEIANVAIEMGSMVPVNPDSASGVNLAAGNTILRVDDLTYDPPSSPPESSFLIGSNPTFTSVTPGQQVSVKVPITWSNNPNPSASPVSLEATTPVGVTAEFSPPTTTTGTSTLTLKAAKSAFAGRYTVRIDGYVDKGGASEKHAEDEMELEVITPFLAISPGQINLAPCTPRQTALQVPAASNFSDPLTIDVKSFQPNAAITSITPGEVLSPSHATATVFQEKGMATATITLSAAPGTKPASPKSLVVVASSPGYAESSASASILIEAGNVSKLLTAGSNVTPTSVSTPELGIPGSKLTLEGAGFCPGTKVGIGDPNGPATPESIGSDGKSLTFRVPRSAVTGKVRVIPPGGEPFEGEKVVPVKSFRNTFGFSWPNSGDYGMTLNGEMVDELFGEDETNINVFGWLVRKPEASLYEFIANKFIPKGICFGMAYSSQEMRQFPLEISTFPRTGNDVWSLSAPEKPSPQLLRYVIERFSLQFTDQVIPIITGQVLGQTINAHPANEDLSMIESEIAQGRPVEIGLIHWNGATPEAHSVLAYDTEPQVDGRTAVFIANSNTPYTTVEEKKPAVHDESEFKNSTILINSNGHWWLEELGWEGHDANLVVFKHDDLPILNGKQPKLPNVFTAALTGGVVLVFGSGGDDVTQVSGDNGKTTVSKGQLADQAQWPKGFVPASPFTSSPGPLQLVYADARKADPLTATVKRGAKGGAMSMDLPGLQATIDADAKKGQVDKVGADPGGRFVSYQSGAGSTPYDATLLAAAAASGAQSSSASQAKSEHVVEVGATAGSSGAERLSFQGGGQFQLRHQGPSGKVSLTLSALRADGQPVAVRLPRVAVPHGASISVAPLRWSALASRPVRVRVEGGGRADTLLLRGRPIARRFAGVKSARLHGGKKASVDLKLRLRHAPAGAWVSPAVEVMRAGHTVAKTAPAQLQDAALRAGKARLKLDRPLSAGRYKLRVRLLEATSEGPIQGSTVVTETLGVKAKGG